MDAAVVTGASRGVGRGIASSLADAGYRVYATGRSIASADLPASVIRIPCDHVQDDQTAAVFARLEADGLPLGILVNSGWGGYEGMMENGVFVWSMPFWQQAARRWPSMIDAGVRAAFFASTHAARIMVEQKRGLIVNLSYWAAQKYMGNVVYGIAKAATDKLSADMAQELRPHGVAAISLYPGLVRTEAVLEAAKAGWLDLGNSESPEYCGRVIAALAQSPEVLDRTGQVVVAAQAAAELGIVDVDGRRRNPLTLESA
jgi:NAD(P)-dependent dehydrogenase (short-subunit alcohol dehydrogenase family)